MTPPRASHRAEFTVRCECGNEFHTDDSHIGKSLRCRCGRTVLVARTQNDYVSSDARAGGSANAKSTGTKRRKRAASGPAVIIPVRHRLVHWADALRNAPTAAKHGLIESLRQMGDMRTTVRWTSRLSWGYFVLLAITWIVLITTSEHFLPATLLAYGPRFVVLLPLLLLVPAALFLARPALFPQLLAAWIGVHSIMGFRVSWNTLVRRQLPAVPDAGSIRVLTYNVLVGGRLAFDLAVVLKEVAPDIIAFQECGTRLWESVQALPNWHSFRLGSLCTASRWPILAVDSMPREDLTRVSRLGAGGTGLVALLTLDTPRGKLRFVNLHLETVRKGIESVIGSDGIIPDLPRAGQPTGARGVDEGRLSLNAFIRSVESARASVWVLHGAKDEPLIVAGDFNLPVESSIFRQNWGHFTDAFEAAGTGFGWTKKEGALIRARIDHVLVIGPGLRPLRVGRGPDYDSDHLPVVADLAWAGAR